MLYYFKKETREGVYGIYWRGENKEAVCLQFCQKEYFLIGDSIRMGYCASAREALSDVAEVFYVADNCRNTQNVITNLNGWANMFDDPTRVDMVQFKHWLN